MNFEVTKHPDPLLSKVCPRVDASKLDFLKREAVRMMYMMDEAGGVAIAAPQAGLDLSFFVVPVQLFGSPLIINPVVGEFSLEFEDRREGCLSLPGEFHMVRRHLSCRMEYFDSDFVFQSRVFEGFLARVAQHETDHLNGVLIRDHKRQ